MKTAGGVSASSWAAILRVPLALVLLLLAAAPEATLAVGHGSGTGSLAHRDLHARRLLGRSNNGLAARGDAKIQPRCVGKVKLPTTSSSSKAPVATSKPKKNDASGGNGGGSKPSSGGGKKGLAWGADDNYLKNFAGHGVKYVYNWRSQIPKHVDQLGLKYAAMLWNGDGDRLSDFRSIRNQVDYLMGPNEVNLGSQADMSVGETVALWRKEFKPFGDSHYLVSPSVTSAPSGFGWMGDFLDKVGDSVDAISLHFYGTTADELISYVEKFHKAYGKNVWLSEYGCQDFAEGRGCTNSETQAFMHGVQSWAESTGYITMYAPFGMLADVTSQGVASYNGMMAHNGEPNSNGRWFLYH